MRGLRRTWLSPWSTKIERRFVVCCHSNGELGDLMVLGEDVLVCNHGRRLEVRRGNGPLRSFC